MSHSAGSSRVPNMSSSLQHELVGINPFIGLHQAPFYDVKSLTSVNVLASKPAYFFGRLIYQGASQCLQLDEVAMAATMTSNHILDWGNSLYGLPAASTVFGLDPSWGQQPYERHAPPRGMLETGNDLSYLTEPHKYSSSITSKATVPWSMDSTPPQRGRLQVDPKSWLPEGWQVTKRKRTSGKTAGVVDKYYIDPTGRRFRSKKEVQEFLETGTARTRKVIKISNTDVNALGVSGRGRSNKSKIADASCFNSF